MNDETPEKVARDMIAQADILAMMGNQPLSSLKVVEQLKKFAERILNSVKPDEHAARMEPTAGSEKPWHPLEIPEIGIDFKRYHSKDCDVFVCAWRNEFDSHVYEVRMRRTENGWRVVMANDGRKLCSMLAPSRQLAYRFALGAMRGYLRRGHRRTLKHAAAAALATTAND